MQTFLPYPDFEETMRCLDYRRLGKQRVEARQILDLLVSPPERPSLWQRHPAVLMWKGYEAALALYHDAAIREWVKRGYNNNMEFRAEWDPLGFGKRPVVMPWWLGDERVHSGYRSNLLRKDPTHYGQFGWTEPHDLPYEWPTKMEIAA